MSNKTIIFLAFSCVLLLFSCKKDGCTQCSATNFNKRAKEDDNSCQFKNESFMGTYAVQDSIAGPPTLDWEFSSYEITVEPAECGQDNLTFSNYADKNNSFNGTTFNPQGTICGSRITMLREEINNTVVRSTTGYFSNDSIYLDIEFENSFGEVFFGSCFGKKQ